MTEDTPSYDLSADGKATIEAVDGYLEQAIADGRPLEALIATRRLGEVADGRAKEAARVATEGSWSWTDVGRALGVTKQAAHEKLRARVRDKLDEQLTKLEQAEQAGHAKIARRAQRGRDREQRKHDKLDRGVQKAREEIARAAETVDKNLGKRSEA
jgi:hypothetical protein